MPRAASSKARSLRVVSDAQRMFFNLCVCQLAAGANDPEPSAVTPRDAPEEEPRSIIGRAVKYVQLPVEIRGSRTVKGTAGLGGRETRGPLVCNGNTLPPRTLMSYEVCVGGGLENMQSVTSRLLKSRLIPTLCFTPTIGQR